MEKNNEIVDLLVTVMVVIGLVMVGYFLLPTFQQCLRYLGFGC